MKKITKISEPMSLVGCSVGTMLSWPTNSGYGSTLIVEDGWEYWICRHYYNRDYPKKPEIVSMMWIRKFDGLIRGTNTYATYI